MPPVTRAKRPALSNVLSESGDAPGLFGALAQSPATLNGYRGFDSALAEGSFSDQERALIALMVAQRCGSAYWLSVQTRLARKAGLESTQIASARDGYAGSERSRALLFLAGKLVVNHGELSDADMAAVRQAGLTDQEVIEATAQVALNLAATFIGHAARLELDFPAAPPLPGF